MCIFSSVTSLWVSRHQVWGVFQAYYAEGILAGTSPATLSLLGGIPGAVRFRISFMCLVRLTLVFDHSS